MAFDILMILGYTVSVSAEISVRDAAELTGYSQAHIYWLLDTGRVKGRKVVTVWQIDKADLLAYMRKMEADPRGGPRRKS